MQVGVQIGPYQIVEVITRQAPAATWFVARDRAAGPNGRRVLLQITYLGPQAEATALQAHESRVVCSFDHPNVLRTFTIDADGPYDYLAREYFIAPSLTDLRVAPPIALAVLIGREVCEALHYLHTRTHDGQPLGLLHGGVTADRVLVDSDGNLKLVYPGREIIFRGRSTTLAATTLAPEVLRGRPRAPSVDLYALADLLWELTVGRARYVDEPSFAIMKHIMEDEPESPSAVVANYPADLAHVIMRGLAREPSARFATAREMADALADVAHSLPAVDHTDLARFVRARLAGTAYPPTCLASDLLAAPR